MKIIGAINLQKRFCFTEVTHRYILFFIRCILLFITRKLQYNWSKLTNWFLRNDLFARWVTDAKIFRSILHRFLLRNELVAAIYCVSRIDWNKVKVLDRKNYCAEKNVWESQSSVPLYKCNLFGKSCGKRQRFGRRFKYTRKRRRNARCKNKLDGFY